MSSANMNSTSYVRSRGNVSAGFISVYALRDEEVTSVCANGAWSLPSPLPEGCARAAEQRPDPDVPDRAGLELIQPDLFAAGGAYTNAWADFDNDGDLDLFVGFGAGIPNRLYRNDGGTFVDVAGVAGVADTERTRGASWGDFNSDGRLDLYVGFAFDAPTGNRLYRNDGKSGFTDIAPSLGVDFSGQTRQISWIDYDIDGDVDLFIAFRDQAKPDVPQRRVDIHRRFRGDRSGRPRKAVGAVWFDFDRDGDLDVFIANQEDDPNALYRNDGSVFVDVAETLGLNGAGRRPGDGSVGPCLTDFDADGRLDLFVANYGPSVLYTEDESGNWVDRAPELGLDIDTHAVSCAWGDYDLDARPDVYVSGYVNGALHYPDHFFRNGVSGFTDVMTGLIQQHDADHGFNGPTSSRTAISICRWPTSRRKADTMCSGTPSAERVIARSRCWFSTRTDTTREQGARSGSIVRTPGNSWAPASSTRGRATVPRTPPRCTSAWLQPSSSTSKSQS